MGVGGVGGGGVGWGVVLGRGRCGEGGWGGAVRGERGQKFTWEGGFDRVGGRGVLPVWT